MKTNYCEYSQWDYLNDEKFKRIDYLINYAKEDIKSSIECLMDMYVLSESNKSELDYLKNIDLDSISLNNIHNYMTGDCYPDEEKELEEIVVKLDKLEKSINNVNEILTRLPDGLKIECSSKSESTYVTYPKEMLEEFVNKYGFAIQSNYYEELEQDELNDLSTFKVRISCHDVGNYFDENMNSHIEYSQECISIITDDINLNLIKNKSQNNEMEMACNNEMEL